MSLQRLGGRKIRRLAAATGLQVQMAWADGPGWVQLRTFEDEHFVYDWRTGELKPDLSVPEHMSSCPGYSNYNAEEWRRQAAI